MNRISVPAWVLVAWVAALVGAGTWQSASQAQPNLADLSTANGSSVSTSRSGPCSECAWSMYGINPTSGQYDLVMSGAGVLGGVIINAGDWVEFYDSDDPEVRNPQDYLGHYTSQSGPATSVDLNVRFSKGLIALVNAQHARPVMLKFTQD